MKNVCNCLFILSVLLCLLPAAAYSTPADEPAYVTVSGIVRDRSDRKILAYATVSIAGGTESTVTNADGAFTFKVKEPLDGTELEVSHLGYLRTRIRLKAGETDLQTVWLTPSSQLLDAVTVSGYPPRELVEEALRKVPDNYSSEANRLTGFYRETVRKRRHYINLAEAVVDLHKTAYSQDVRRDRVRIVKGRRLLSPKSGDTLAVKLLGGPTVAVYLDVVKNPDLLLNQEELHLYDFYFEETVFLDNRPQYVVGFYPNRSLPYPLFYGKLYIDQERLSFTRAEFSLDLTDRYKATQAILRKKPAGLRFRPLAVTYLANYEDRGGKTYLSYVRNEIRFKCDWRRKLFSTTYAVTSEMVVTDISPSLSGIPFKEAFGRNRSFSDDVALFFDPDFWGNYNIIEPDESLEKAADRLRKLYE